MQPFFFLLSLLQWHHLRTFVRLHAAPSGTSNDFLQSFSTHAVVLLVTCKQTLMCKSSGVSLRAHFIKSLFWSNANRKTSRSLLCVRFWIQIHKQQQKLPWQELHCLNSESRIILFNIRFIVNELTALEAWRPAKYNPSSDCFGCYKTAVLTCSLHETCRPDSPFTHKSCIGTWRCLTHDGNRACWTSL